MVDKIVELLQGLQDDVHALRSDVHTLSDKVDNLSIAQSKIVTKKEILDDNAQMQQQTSNVNYGRKLTQTEQKYVDKLHEDGVVEKTSTNQYEEIIEEKNSNVAPQAPPIINTKTTTVPHAPQIHQKSVMERFFAWLAKDWPMKVGGFFVIASVGWFVTYAASVGWLSPVARVVLGYLFAIACIGFGSMRATKERTQGNVFLIIGIGAMLISTLAGLYFEIITYVIGLFIMLISVGFVTLVSLKQKSISLTSSMIFFGAIIPLFFFADVGVNTIFVYLFVLTLGTLWVVSITKWRGLTTMMLAVVAFYSIAYIVSASSSEIESFSNIIVAFVFVGVFYIANVSAILASQKTENFDLVTAFGTGTLFLIWMLSFTPEEMEVFVLLIGVLFFAIASYIIFVKTTRKEPTAIYGGVAAVLFAVATALLFSGPVLVTAFLVEAAVATIVALYIAKRDVSQSLLIFLTILYGAPVAMSLDSVIKLFDFTYSQGINIMDMMPYLFTIFMVCVTAFSVAISVLRLTDIDEQENMTFFRLFAYLGGVYALMLVWFVTHLFMNSYDVATFVSLVIYTIVGVGFYVMGVRESYKPYMVVGGILFGIVVARVLFVEFWEMDIVMRIITSFVLGTLLISTAFIKSNKK
jgi:hypothetical protein